MAILIPWSASHWSKCWAVPGRPHQKSPCWLRASSAPATHSASCCWPPFCPSLAWKVLRSGLNTNTPELKQSGQPASGAAESSSRWKSSSELCMRSVSASRKTHLLYSVSLQQWIYNYSRLTSRCCLRYEVCPGYLGESYPQLSPLQQLEVDNIFAVKRIHNNHPVKCLLQHFLHFLGDLASNHDAQQLGCLDSLERLGECQGSHGVIVVGGEGHPGLHLTHLLGLIWNVNSSTSLVLYFDV